MALVVFTRRPNRLLRQIREAIEEGTVTTWAVDADGDFTHTSDQTGGQAWFRAATDDSRLVFTIVPLRSKPISKFTYAYYHGHFTLMLLRHFDDEFEEVMSTASASLGDKTR